MNCIKSLKKGEVYDYTVFLLNFITSIVSFSILVESFSPSIHINIKENNCYQDVYMVGVPLCLTYFWIKALIMKCQKSFIILDDNPNIIIQKFSCKYILLVIIHIVLNCWNFYNLVTNTCIQDNYEIGLAGLYFSVFVFKFLFFLILKFII